MPRFSSPFLAEFVDHRPITRSALLVNEIHLEENIDKYHKTFFDRFLGRMYFARPFLTKR